MNAHVTTCRLSMRSIIELAARHFGVSTVDIVSQRRDIHIVEARHIAIYAIRELLPRSYPEIGRAVGGRDHTTIMNACRSVAANIVHHEEKRTRVERFLTICRAATPLMQPDVDPFEIAHRIMQRPGLATNVSIETIRNFAAIVSAAILEASRQDEATATLEASRTAFATIQPELLAFIRAFHGLEASSDRGEAHARRSFDKYAAALVAAAEAHFNLKRTFK